MPSSGTHIVWDWNGTLKDDLDDLLAAMNSTPDRHTGQVASQPAGIPACNERIADLVIDFDETGHLHMVIEELARLADQLVLPDEIDAETDISEDLEDQIYPLTRQFAYLASTTARRNRDARNFPDHYPSSLRHGTAALARAAAPLGQALAELGAAVTQIGVLHDLAGQRPTPERSAAELRTRAHLEHRITSARTLLRTAARQLRTDAQHHLITAADPTAAPTHSATAPPPVPPSTPGHHR